MTLFARVALCGLCLACGCHGKPKRVSSNDKVHVDVPFANVRVGQNGGVKVDAPFTHVQTPRYQAVPPPMNSTQFQSQKH